MIASFIKSIAVEGKTPAVVIGNVDPNKSPASVLAYPQLMKFVL